MLSELLVAGDKIGAYLLIVKPDTALTDLLGEVRFSQCAGILHLGRYLRYKFGKLSLRTGTLERR